MSTITPAPHVPNVRTYAGDLNAQRALRGITPKSAAKVETSHSQKTAKKTEPNVITKKITKPATTKVSQPETQKLPVTKIASTVPTAPTRTAIPPFHTFQKPTLQKDSAPKVPLTIDTTELAKKQSAIKPSILAVPDKEILRVDKTQEIEGTIITDTKHARFSLTREIFGAITKRWEAHKKSVILNKQPKYTLPETERRKGVIQKATVRTGRTVAADHSAVLDRIKNTKHVDTETKVDTRALFSSSNPTPTFTTAHTTMQTVSVKPAPPIITQVEPAVSPTTTSESTATWGTVTEESQLPEQKKPLLVPIPQRVPEAVETHTSSEDFQNTEPAPAARVVAVPPRQQAPQQIEYPKILPTLPTIQEPVVETTISNRTEAEQLANLSDQIKTIEHKVFTPPVAQESSTVAVPTIQEPVVEPPVRIITPHERPRIIPTLPQTNKQIIDTNPDITPKPVAEIISEVDATGTPRPMANWAVPKTATLPLALQRVLTDNQATATKLRTLVASTNSVALGGVGFIFIGIIAWFFMHALFTKVATTLTTDTADTTLHAIAFSDSTLFNAPHAPLTKMSMIDLLTSKSSGNDTLVEVVFSQSDGTNRASADEILSLFSTSIVTDFRNAASNIALGGYRGEPWILLTITNAEAARGGMLQWEKTLSGDLAPWFGAPIKQNTHLGITPFTDDVIGAYDVRVLTDDQKTERITYGFIGSNKLLITSNTTAFLNLSEKIQR